VKAPRNSSEQLTTNPGNSRRLFPLVGRAISTIKSQISQDKLRALDLFSGSGVVSRYLKAHSTAITANDLELYSHIINTCYLSNPTPELLAEIDEAVRRIHHAAVRDMHEGFIARLYAPRRDDHIQPGERAFYTRRNAMYIDTCRQLIDREGDELRPFLIAPLLAAASVHANTSGVFKGFYKNADGVGQFGGSGKDALARILKPIILRPPIFSRFKTETSFYQRDAEELLADLDVDFDIVYLDPPYNQHPYGSNYFMLNLISTYKQPDSTSEVSGIPIDWNRSPYNKRQVAADTLFRTIELCRARFLLISYNSEGFISHATFLERLSKLGRLTAMETAYNTFRGSRNLRSRPLHVTEYLYLLEKA